jgi:hypothetical protein
MNQSVSCTDGLRAWERFEATHRPIAALQMLMVAFDRLLIRLAGMMLRLRQGQVEGG